MLDLSVTRNTCVHVSEATGCPAVLGATSLHNKMQLALWLEGIDNVG
jgi:hypothetical protein